MKKIIFVRHGKSSWEYDVSDVDRPLKKRGNTDAGLVSEAFSSCDIRPEVVFSSPAKRAFETCKIFVRNLKIIEENVRINEDLYDFGGQNVVQFIKLMPDKYKTVIIFGHNHALTSIVNTYGNIYIDNLPTSGLVAIAFDIDNWKDLKQGETVKTIFPRDLKV